MIYKIDSRLTGVKKIIPSLHKDNRGKFLETWNKKLYENLIGDVTFCKDNLSFSKKNVIRGLHYQYPEDEQGKLVYVLLGRILDVVVDIRKESPSFGEWDSFTLDDQLNHQVWIPKGFAHGFCVLSDYAVVQYKCTAPWNKLSENIIRWNDPRLNIKWPISDPIISKKDNEALLLLEQKRLPKYD